MDSLFLRATLDLAHEIAAAGGGESPGVAHERAEVARLRARLKSPDDSEPDPATAAITRGG